MFFESLDYFLNILGVTLHCKQALCVCVCVCVCERERESKHIFKYLPVRVSMRVSFCQRKSEG